MPLVLEPPRHGGLSSIALVPGRHLVGAAADCAIRLQAEGVLDRHAMILVGENRTIVKAIDSRTWVNDGPVSEMALRAGDRLSIGPITFRIRAAAADELAAFDVPEPVESREQSDLPTTKSNHDEVSRPREVAAVSPMPVSVSHEAEAVGVGRLLPTYDEVVVQSAEPLKVTSARTAVALEVSQASAGTGGMGGNFEVVDSPIPEGHGVASETPNPDTDVRMTDNSALERRLDEIQKRLADLGQTEFSFTAPVEVRPARSERGIVRGNPESHVELTARAEQLARESSELQQRIEKVAEREGLLEQRQLSLVQEAERIAQVAEIARQSLADEHAEHFSIWQEWEGTFQRLTSDLAAQLSSFERQRDAFKLETQRFQTAQVELRNARSDHERERQTLLAERIRLQNELADLSTLRSQQERLQSQSQRDLDEQSIRLEVERKRLQDERAELATMKIDLLRQRQVFDLDRSQFDVTRTAMEASLRDVEVRCQRAESDLSHWRQQQQAEFTALAQSREDEAGQLRELQNCLDDARRQLQSEQDIVSQLRRELENAQKSRETLALPQLDPVSTPIWVAPSASELQPVVDTCVESADPVSQNTIPILVGPPAETPPGVSLDTPNSPISPSDDGIWTVGPTAERNDTNSPETSHHWNSTESFGAVVDWTALAAIEQEFGQGTTFSDQRHTLEVGEKRVEVVVDKLDSHAPNTGEGASSPAPAMPSVWPEQTIWPVTIPPFEGARIDDQARLIPAATAKVSAKVGQNIDDPWADISGSEANVTTTSPATSLDEILNSGMDVTSQENPAQPLSGFAAAPFFNSLDPKPPTNETQDVRETLAEVNREFGTAVQEPSGFDSKPSLPAWWVENTKPESRNEEMTSAAGKPSWVLDALRGTADDQPSEGLNVQAGEPVEPENQLRSQLAKLFELPAQQSSASEQIAEPDSDRQPVQAVTVRAEAESAPIREDAAPQGEDSVEAFMARLLARSRTGGSDSEVTATPHSATTPSAVRPAQVNPGNDADESAASVPGDQDRSHLMQGPKHKQDRQAVRENLQSFRQVAHLSARSALAKHSIQQLRNATIAKGVLLAASGLATVWFFGEPLVGRPLQLWKGSACALGLILSVIEFSRSWRQLMKPIRAATASNCDLGTADEAVTPESSEAAVSQPSPESTENNPKPVDSTENSIEAVAE